MITLDQSFNKNNQSNQTGQDFQMFFFLLELLSKTDFFLKRGAERGGEINSLPPPKTTTRTKVISFSKDINTPYLKCFTSCNKTSSNSLRFSY